MALRGNFVLVAMLDVKRATAFGNALVELGYDIRTARDGDEAEHVIERDGAPQLLIADVSLPKIDGLALVRDLRRHAAAEAAGVIVVSAHEALRARARQFASALGISRILPLDVDRATLRQAVLSAVPHHTIAGPKTPPSEPASGDPCRLENALAHATSEVTRRFHVSTSVAYLKIRGHEQMAAHFNIVNPSITPIESPDLGVLRQIAMVREPFVLPDIETSSGDEAFAVSKSGLVRGFAAMPVAVEHCDAVGVLCLMDTRPLTLSARDLDGLASLAGDLGRHIETELESPAPAPIGRLDRNELMPEEIKALEILAVTDPLTGLANRRGGEQNIASEISRAKRQKTPLSCILIDIDRFKDVNDTYGHQAGDHLLREISALLRRTVRGYDILVRWGGEEFLIVLPGVDLDQARRLAERVRHAVEILETQGIGTITISAGAATLGNDYDFESMLALADHQLYEAKGAGRNCVA